MTTLDIPWTLAALAEKINATLQGITPEQAAHVLIEGMAPLTTATPTQLAFLAQSRYRAELARTQAAAVLMTITEAQQFKGVSLIVDNPYAAFAILSHCFDNTPKLAVGIHSSAVVHATAIVHESAAVGAHVVIEANSCIGADVQLQAGVFVGARCQIGAGSFLGPHAVVQHDCIIGERVRVHSGAVIGADGFGFAPDKGQWQRIAQLGAVQIGSDSRIGANTTIDRGALDDTIIGHNVIIDNQVQIGHNVHIGDYTAIAACCGIAGSTRIGQHCILAGGVGIVGHISITDNVHLTGMTMVTKSIEQAGSYSSGTAMSESKHWKKMAVQLRQLPDFSLLNMQKQIQALQAEVAALKRQDNP